MDAGEFPSTGILQRMANHFPHSAGIRVHAFGFVEVLFESQKQLNAEKGSLPYLWIYIDGLCHAARSKGGFLLPHDVQQARIASRTDPRRCLRILVRATYRNNGTTEKCQWTGMSHELNGRMVMDNGLVV
jgi:hypothetical protein